jgi:hypothetical protein
MITIFPPALQWPPECSGPPINKPHTLTNGHTHPPNENHFYLVKEAMAFWLGIVIIKSWTASKNN